jgi:menaquinol-cytochrome c reductase iron-sulfur subunit
MSESNHHSLEHEHNEEKPANRKEMSRRQFLNYTLGGTGGFLMAMPLIPMIRFTVDPLLQPKTASEFTKVGVNAADITVEPQSFKFQVHQVDGWYESNPTIEVWMSKDQSGNIFALSPVCKHLGCTVNWDSQEEFPNEYFCPCHGARYTKKGESLAVAPAPLDEYEVKVDENGEVYVGQLKPNTMV